MDVGIWISALVTLAVFSVLYRENPVFRAVEHVGVGLAAGYALVTLIRSSLLPRVASAGVAEIAALVVVLPACVGLALAPRRRTPLARLGLALAASIAAGLAAPGLVHNLVIAQMRATMVPVGLSTRAGFDSLVMAIGVLTAMAYFSFSKEPRGVRGVMALAGLYVLMIALGASFGYEAMSKFMLLIGRFLFLLKDWLHLIS